MVYFSEILNKKVYTESRKYIGRLKDLIFLSEGAPTVTKIVVSDRNEYKMIPMSSVIKFNSIIVLSDNFEPVSLEKNELYVNRNILDKQIIDLQGSKVVRVNDVLLQNMKNQWYVSGFDTSIGSVLRWFGLEKPVRRLFRFFDIEYSTEVLSWSEVQPLELARGMLRLKLGQDKLKKVRPEDLADYLEVTTIQNAHEMLKSMDEKYAAEVINSLNISYQTELFKKFDSSSSARIISLVEPDEAVDILFLLHNKKRQEILDLLKPHQKAKIEHLLQHAHTPIGDLMTTQFFSVQSNETVGSVLKSIHEDTDHYEQLYYVYILNSDNQLVGVCNLHELLLQDTNVPLYQFMISNVVVLHLYTPEEIAISRILKYKISALPVIDKNKRLLGVLTLDDIAEFVIKKLP